MWLLKKSSVSTLHIPVQIYNSKVAVSLHHRLILNASSQIPHSTKQMKNYYEQKKKVYFVLEILNE